MTPFPRSAGASRLRLVVFGFAMCLASSCRGRSRPPAASQNEPADETKTAQPQKPKQELKIEDVQVGTGATAAVGKRVAIHYTGWLNGAKFDTSLARKPLEFRLGKAEVLRGWDEGIPGMKVGGKRKLTVPPEKGYGDKGSLGGAIPPNSVLVFDIDLVDVKD